MFRIDVEARYYDSTVKCERYFVFYIQGMVSEADIEQKCIYVLHEYQRVPKSLMTGFECKIVSITEFDKMVNNAFFLRANEVLKLS